MTMKKVKPEDKFPIVIETFREPSWALGGMIQREPDCFNSIVSVVKYRITAEIVDEPIETIHQRIQDLWDRCDNTHHWYPLKNMAVKYNYNLINSPGSKWVKK